MVVGGVAIGALSIASAFTVFQFMRRGSGSISSSKSTLTTEKEAEAVQESETIVQLESVQESEVRSDIIVELETGSHENLYERPYERPFERPSLGLSIGPSVGPSIDPSVESVTAEPVNLASETSNPLTYLSIDPAHVDEITQFLAALKKRAQGTVNVTSS